MRVAIVTLPRDLHAHAVRWALREHGVECTLLYPFDLSGGKSWSFYSASNELKTDDGLMSLDECSSVWMRRPAPIYPQAALSDLSERAAAETETEHLASGALHAFEHGKFAVNELAPSRRANYKTLQFSVAQRAGLLQPDTLVSNDPGDIISFFRQHRRRIVYKPLKSFLWTRSDGRRTFGPTTVITDEEFLKSADLLSSPGIYQEVVDRESEIRVTVMGRAIHAWKKRFPYHVSDAYVDWRTIERDAIYEAVDLPPAVSEPLFRLMDGLGLVFGCADFLVDKDGRFFFLEINPQGQFLWGDELGIGVEQLDAFARFLISRDPLFDGGTPRGDVSLARFRSSQRYEEECLVEMAAHHGELFRYRHSRVAI